MLSQYVGAKIYLDSNIIIYALEEGFRCVDQSRSLLEAIDSRWIDAVTSELTIAEVMAKPMAARSRVVLEQYERFFSAEVVQLCPVSREILFASASVQNSMGLKLIDAIHVATAQAYDCSHLMSHDEQIGRALLDRPKWLRLSDLT